jgi:excisionase family DNA binding protein
MNVAEAARELEVSTGTIYQLCLRGKLGHTRIGLGRGTIRITASDIAALRQSGRVEPEDAQPAAPSQRPDRKSRKYFERIARESREYMQGKRRPQS